MNLTPAQRRALARLKELAREIEQASSSVDPEPRFPGLVAEFDQVAELLPRAVVSRAVLAVARAFDGEAV